MSDKKNIEVQVPANSVVSGVGKTSGNSFTVQTMGLVGENGFVTEFKRFIKNPSEALPPGRYSVALDSAFIDRKTGNMILQPQFTLAK